MIDPELDGKVALITGANNPRGIGAATARALALQGVATFLTHLGPPPPPEVLATIEESGGKAAAGEADLADPSSIPPLFDAAEAAFGPVDILVNNAAHSDQDSFRPLDVGARDWAGRPLQMVTAESHDVHFAVNSRAVALMTAEYARRFAARGSRWGRIVNVSTDGAPGFPGEVSYGASKAALESYSRAAAQELGPLGITVNVVSPGPTQTGWIPPDLEEQIARTIPLGRVGRPEDVADVILLLASAQARWLTGQTLYVGGGHRMI